MKLIRCEILLEPIDSSKVNKDLSAQQAFEVGYEFVPCYLAKDQIIEFHPDRESPYRTLVSLTSGETVAIDTEFEEFAKLYEQ